MELTEDMFRFFLAGLVATAVDFLGYNAFLRYVRMDERVVASVVSVTFAMAVSFFLNRFWVFSKLNPEGWPIGAFLAVTLTSAYGIQSIVIYLLSRAWRAKPPPRLTAPVSELLGLGQSQAADMIERNTIKLIAVGAGLFWNFSWYRWYVFA